MVSERARKKRTRAHKKATGDRYVQARRATAEDAVYFAPDWVGSAWARLLPLEGVHLRTVIDTATVLSMDGDISDLLATHSFSDKFPKGIRSHLSWGSIFGETDNETDLLSKRAESAFRDAVTSAGLEVPTDVASLARLLEKLGILRCTRSPKGRIQWRSTYPVPSVSSVLPTPADWVTYEEEARWLSMLAWPTVRMIDYLGTSDRKHYSNVSLERLSNECEMRVEYVRLALEGLMYRCNTLVQRNSIFLDRRDISTLPEHGRFSLTLMSQNRRSEGSSSRHKGARYAWNSTPWRAYFREREEHLTSALSKVLFELRIDGVRRFIGLAGIGALERCSSSVAAKLLCELEDQGHVSWCPDQKVAEFAPMDRRHFPIVSSFWTPEARNQ
jgi:hypothetical protein